MGFASSASARALATRLAPLTAAIALGFAFAPSPARATAYRQFQFPTAPRPEGATVVDVNRDGRPDLVVTSWTTASVAVQLGTGTGFTAPVSYPTVPNPIAVVATDLNHDGVQDLVVASGSRGTMSVLLGTADGTFGARTDFTCGSFASALVVGDWNHDGRTDVALAESNAGVVAVLLGDGAGGFGRVQTYPAGGTGTTGIATADLDGDGNADLVVGNVFTDRLVVLHGDGTGQFDNDEEVAVGGSPTCVVLADLNGDGKPEALVALGDGPGLTELALTPAGSFAVTASLPTGDRPASIALADLRATGWPDIIAANSGDGTIAILPALGGGAYGAASAYLTGAHPVWVGAGRFNDDAVLDVVATLQDSSRVVLLASQRISITAFASSPNPSHFLQPDTLTATVNPSTATGTVRFLDGAAELGRASLAPGEARLVTTALGVGLHSLTAVYDGDVSLQPSVSPSVMQRVLSNGNAPAVTIASSLNPSFIGQSVTLWATISPVPPSGTVAFMDSLTVLGTAPVNAGVATFSLATLAIGAHPISAVYSGDATTEGNGSEVLVQRVTALHGTAIALAATPDPSVLGEPVVLRATVTHATTPGVVTFKDGGTGLGNVATNAYGVAQLTTTFTSAGRHVLTASFAGSPTDSNSTSAAWPQDVNLVPTSMTIASSLNPVFSGRAVTFTATVTSGSNYSGSPTGTVQFTLDGVPYGVPIVMYHGAATTPARTDFPAGDHVMRASYAGTTWWAGCQSPALAVHSFAGSPSLRSIRDVTGDQGRFVRVAFRASALDTAGASPAVVRYAIFRRVDAVPAAAAREAGPAAALLAGWEQVASVDAFADTLYLAVAPTLVDSNATGAHRVVFLVRAVTATPSVYFDSAPDSGYSVDNVPPTTPAPFTAARLAQTTRLHWGANREPDFAVYRLYRGTAPDFAPGPENLVVQQPDTGYVDTAPAGACYRLSALDLNGNESGFALVQVASAPGDGGGLAFALQGAWPNPATGGALHVRFTLAEGAPAVLELLDVGGRRVQAQAAGAAGAGRYDVDLARTSRIGPGLYFVRLTQAGRSARTRVVVLP